MEGNKQEKTIYGLSVERRDRLSAINTNASRMGLIFTLISEDLVANNEETDKLIEEAEDMLKQFEEIQKEYDRKLRELSKKIFSTK